METGYVPSLRTDRPNMGSVLKGLGYTTAYFGKFELNKGLLKVNPAVDYHAALKPYGFDFFNFDGDKFGSPNEGHLEKFFSPSRYESDSLTAMGHGRIGRASHGADGLFRC